MNLDYATVFSLAPYINENLITIIGICLLIGAMAKSSQVGLHVWLPMAMPKKKVADGQWFMGLLIILKTLWPSRRINSLIVNLYLSYSFYTLNILTIYLQNFYLISFFCLCSSSLLRKLLRILEVTPIYRANFNYKINNSFNKILPPRSLTSFRQYSILIRPTKNMNREDFLEWFRGFTDAEGCFFIWGNSDKYFRFFFQIKLHIDDYNVLESIQESLGIGKVYTSKDEATFVVTAKEEVKIIIDIFNKNSLNSTKYLNFLSFKKAFELYTGNSFTEDHKSSLSQDLRSLDLKKEIELIKSNMNSKRFDFKLPESHKIRITNYWLLGFVEGDGSFTLIRNNKYKLRFDISQSSKDLLLMVEIKNYFNLLATKLYNSESYKENLFINKSSEGLPFNMSYLTIKNQLYIVNVLIPLFDSMVWLTKKELDYKDWKVVLKFRELGLHYTKDGLKVIGQIFNLMNNNRLTSNKILSEDENVLLQKDINRLLTEPSNLEVRDGNKVWIKTLNRYQSNSKKIGLVLTDEKGIVLNSFDSVSSCSNFLGISRKTIMKKLSENKAILLNNKLIYINKIELDD